MTIVGSGAMAGVLSPDGVVENLEFVVTCLVVEVEAEFVGLAGRTGVTVTLVSGTPGSAAVAAAGREAAVVGWAVFGLAAPGCRGVVGGSSWAELVSRGVREALLISGAPGWTVVGNEAVGFPAGTAEGRFGGRIIFCLKMGSELSDCFALGDSGKTV